MRLEVGGAQITEAVVEVLDTLQNDPSVARSYAETLDCLARYLILEAEDEEEQSRIMPRLRAIQMMRRDILALASPPDVDLPENDIPVAAF